jgi:hypothetical protein
MKSRTWRLFLLLILVGLLMSGCASVSYDVKVHSDLSADASVKVLVDTSLVDLNDKNVKKRWDEIQEEATQNGYTVTPVKEGVKTGFVATKRVANVEELSLSDVFGDKTGEKSAIVTKKGGFLYDQYAYAMPYEGLIGDQTSTIEKSVLSQMEVHFQFESPDGVIEKWDLNPGEKNTIEGSFKHFNEKKMFIYSVLLLVLIILWMIIRRILRKRKSNQITYYTPTYK